MTRSYLIITLLALIGAAGAGMNLKKASQNFAASHKVSSIQPEQEAPVKAKPAPATPSLAGQDWGAIAARDPFSFDRSDAPILAPTVQAARPTSPKPLLFGTMMIGDSRIALLRSSNGSARSSRSLKVGEVMEGWKLVQIDDKSVVVESDAVRETLVINDPTVLVPRDHSKTMITAAPAIAPAPVNVAPAASVQSQSAVSVPQGDSRAPVVPTKTRVIDTPFGKKVVPEP